MALDANALVSWQYVKDILGLDASEQAATENLINAASASANRFTNRLLAARDHVRILDGSGRPELLLPEYPINSIARLCIDVTRVFSADSEVTAYLFDAETGQLIYEAGFPEAWQCVKVEWNAGYVPGSTVPTDLQLAVVEIVDWYRNRIRGDAIGIRAIQNPDGIMTQFELDLPLSARSKLGSYVKVR